METVTASLLKMPYIHASFYPWLLSKRLLFERLGVSEYWVINVAISKVVAFSVADGGSAEIRVSKVLPGLAIKTVEETLQRGRSNDDGAINRWLIEQFSQ